MQTSLKAELLEEISQKHLLNHAFYRMWERGTLPIEVMRKYAEQYYHLEKSFPTFLSRMHASCDDQFDVRRTITENMYDEEHGEENHRELWLRYAEGIGASREDVETSSPIKETQETIETFSELASDYLTGSAALAAYESQIPEVAKTKVHGLKEHYGITESETTKFFDVHGEIDVQHAESWWKIIDDYANTQEKKEAVREAVQKGRDALWNFLDGVCREYRSLMNDEQQAELDACYAAVA